MADVRVTFAGGLTDRLVGLATREVRPDGIDLEFVIEDSPRKIFDRMAGPSPYDVCEMSLSEYVTRIDAQQCPLAGIPVFPSRMFRHGFIVVNNKAISSPADLRGKRIGVPIYTTTASVYIRALLQHEYGVDLAGVQWLTGDLDKPGGHGAPTVMPLLGDVTIEHNTSDKSLGQLLAENEIQAIIGPTLPSILGKHPDVERLFPDHERIEAEYFKRTGIFPIMHLVTIRKEVIDRHPFVARSLFEAFSASKDLALKRLRSNGTLPYMLPWMAQDLEQLDMLFGGDPWPYGVEANRRTLEAFTRYLTEQGMTNRTVSLEELFAAS